jgi:hypothetical protein
MVILWRKKENEMTFQEHEAYEQRLKDAEKAYHLLSLHHNALLLQNMELRSHRTKSCWWCRLKYTVATFRGKEE